MFHGRTHPSGMSHSLVPPFIELRCPKCSGVLTCIHPANAQGLTDTPSGWWNTSSDDSTFVATCNSCFYKKENLSYFDLPTLGELYYQTSVGTTLFWAWNHEHLQMLLSFLEGKHPEQNRWWRRYRDFIPGVWKQPSRRNAFIKAGKKLLSST